MADDDRLEELDGPVAPREESVAQEQLARREGTVTAEIFEAVRVDPENPVQPVRLKPEDAFCFSCHKGVSCWNKCCYGTDVTLTPIDILRLCRRLGLKPREFLERYTVPAIWEKAGLPVAKLKMRGEDGKGPCSFLDEVEGCTVYADRPATCRYYPLGLAAIKMRDVDGKAEFHFMVKEPHCKGHEERKIQTVVEFRKEQGVEEYDALNSGWIDILMKMVSWKTLGGPGGKDITPQAQKMFYMVSTDVDAFRRFVFESRFLEIYVVDPDVVEDLRTNDEALLQLGFDWLKNVLFNEPTIAMRDEVLQRAIARNRTELGGV